MMRVRLRKRGNDESKDEEEMQRLEEHLAQKATDEDKGYARRRARALRSRDDEEHATVVREDYDFDEDKDDDDDEPRRKAKPEWRPGVILRKDEGGWCAHYRCVYESPQFNAMSAPAQRLVRNLEDQWTGDERRGFNNNGRFKASLSFLMRKYGWSRSPATLRRSIAEAMKGKFIVRTRKAKTKFPNMLEALYALTHIPVAKPKPKRKRKDYDDDDNV